MLYMVCECDEGWRICCVGFSGVCGCGGEWGCSRVWGVVVDVNVVVSGGEWWM